MLLLLWKSIGSVIGNPSSVKWYHTVDFPPRCFVSGENGLSVVNPYLPTGTNECAVAMTDSKCTSADIFNNQLVLGTVSGGLYQMDWPSVKSTPCDALNPPDITGLIGTFSAFSGLLSNNIISIESNGSYLGVLTDAGFCYAKQGDSVFTTYPTSSGKQCFVCSDGDVYLAETKRVLYKSTPTDFSSWDQQWSFPSQVNDIWVAEKDGMDTLFVSTASGIWVKHGSQSFHYGSLNYSQVRPEVGADIYQGHLFAMTPSGVDIINMRLKSLESTFNFSGLAFLALENKRLYSK